MQRVEDRGGQKCSQCKEQRSVERSKTFKQALGRVCSRRRDLPEDQSEGQCDFRLAKRKKRGRGHAQRGCWARPSPATGQCQVCCRFKKGDS